MALQSQAPEVRRAWKWVSSRKTVRRASSMPPLLTANGFLRNSYVSESKQVALRRYIGLVRAFAVAFDDNSNQFCRLFLLVISGFGPFINISCESRHRGPAIDLRKQGFWDDHFDVVHVCYFYTKWTCVFLLNSKTFISDKFSKVTFFKWNRCCW